MKKAIKMNQADNVATVLSNVEKDERICVIDENNNRLGEVVVGEKIPFGNKIALQDMKEEMDIIKYDCVIGYAFKPIKEGMLVHVHNVRSNRVNIPDSTIEEVLRKMGVDHTL